MVDVGQPGGLPSNGDVEFGEHTEAARRAQRQQEEAVAAAEQRRRLRSMVTPTDDREVRLWLRKLSEPVTVFGERAMERRERLRGLLATLSEEQRGQLTDRLMLLEVESQPKFTEKFYTEGPPELAALRRRVASFAAARAHERLEGQRSAREAVEDTMEEARLVMADAGRLTEVSSQLGGARPVQGVAISPDNATLATADWSGAVSFWTLEDDIARVNTFQAHEERCTDVQWHPQALCSDASGAMRCPDALSYATASADGTAKLWSMSGTCLETCRGHCGRLARLAFHPSGESMATSSYDGTWRLWDTATCACLLEQEGHSRAVYCVAFHPDGSLCGSGSFDASTRIWDCRTGRNVLTFQGHAYAVLSLAFSPNGYHVATGSLDNTVRVWDLRKRGGLYSIAGHSKLVSNVMFDPTGGHYLLTTSYDRTCKLWSTQTWQMCACLAGHAGVVMGADIAKDGSGTVVTTSYDKSIRLWRPHVDDAEADNAMQE